MTRGTHGRRHRRRWPLAVLIIVVALGILALLGYRDAQRARLRLTAARADLATVSGTPESLSSPDGRATASQRLRQAAIEVDSGRATLRHSVPFTIARYIPVLRGQRNGLFALVDDARVAVSTGTGLLNDLNASADALHLRGGRIPLDRLDALSGSTRTAGQRLSRLDRPSAQLWGPLRDAREQFNRLDQRLADRLLAGADGLAAARTFLGAVGPRQYFLAVENNAEMRDTGMVLSYGTIAVNDGRLTVGHTGRYGELALTRPAPTPVPAGTAKVFAEIQPTGIWPSTTATPDFAFSGRSMVDMFAQATGQHVDGVIGIDVVALASLLDVIGPVTLPGVPETITAQNATRILLHDLYFIADRGLGQAGRVEALSEFAKAVADRLTKGDVDAFAVAKRLATAAAGGHVKLYSTDHTEEATFERSGIGGGPALQMADRTFHIAVESRLSSKVDYFVDPSVHQDVQILPDGSALIHTTVTVPNKAPAGEPPGYALGPDNIHPEQHHVTGDYVAWVLCWAPHGSVQADSTPESGLEVSAATPLIHPGQTAVESFDTTIPHAVRNGELELRYVPQPRLNPIGFSLSVRGPGWKITGATSFNTPMDRTFILRWGVTR